MKTEILAQHRFLDALLGEVRETFQASDAGRSAREAFSQLRGVLETHFEQEEDLYYPAIWALRPAQKAPLEACVGAHTEFRAMLRQISRLLEGGQLRGALEALDALAHGFERHEVLEEAVLAELDRELAGRTESSSERTP